MHSVVLIQKPPQPGRTSGTASLGVQLGGPHACVTPLPGNVPLPQLCPLPGLVSSASSPQRQGRQVPRSGRTPGFSTPCPCRSSRGRVTSARGPSTVLGRLWCGSPRLHPVQGKEARDSLLPAQLQLLMATPPPVPALCSPPASPPGWGGLSPLPVPNSKTLGQALGQLRKGQEYVQMPLHSTHGWFQPWFGGSRRGQHQCSPRLTHLSPWPWLPPCIWGLQHPMAEAPPHHLPPGSGGAQSRSLSFSGGRWRLVVTQRSPAPSLPCAFLNPASAPSASASSTRPSAGPTLMDVGREDPER